MLPDLFGFDEDFFGKVVGEQDSEAFGEFSFGEVDFHAAELVTPFGGDVELFEE
ncbi:MAG TPA: hypothetical protein PKD76_08475 [Solirubrobacterales bacterium]|nr:hypothetical protein [Solirubrobacterales bacterium]